MFLRCLLLLLAFMPLSVKVDAGIMDNLTRIFRGNEKQSVPSIAILLIHDAQNTNLEIKGKYTLYDPKDNGYISSRFIGKSRPLEAARDGLRWGEAFPGLYQLKIKPDEPTTVAVIDNKTYSGNLFIYDIGGTISIIDQVPVEDYVHSILANSDIASLHPETVAALAIVIRTNAYYQAANPKTQYWAIDGQKVNFTGIPANTANAQFAHDATRVTRNMIMSRTGVYEGVATPFPAEFGFVTAPQTKGIVPSRVSLQEANQMAQSGEHAAQILGKAFPGTTIMLSP